MLRHKHADKTLELRLIVTVNRHLPFRITTEPTWPRRLLEIRDSIASYAGVFKTPPPPSGLDILLTRSTTTAGRTEHVLNSCDHGEVAIRVQQGSLPEILQPDQVRVEINRSIVEPVGRALDG